MDNHGIMMKLSLQYAENMQISGPLSFLQLFDTVRLGNRKVIRPVKNCSNPLITSESWQLVLLGFLKTVFSVTNALLYKNPEFHHAHRQMPLTSDIKTNLFILNRDQTSVNTDPITVGHGDRRIRLTVVTFWRTRKALSQPLEHPLPTTKKQLHHIFLRL